MLARHVLVAAVALGAATTLPACVDDGPGDPLGATAQEVDTTPPTVTLAGPSTAFAPGTVNLTATAADASGIAKVRLFRGLTLWKEDFSAPYTAAIPVALQDLGTQYYVALAYDNAGNTAMSIISTTVVAGARPIIASFTATPGSLPHDLGSPGDPGGNEPINNVSGPATTSLYVETAGVTVTARDNTFEASVQGADALGAYPNHGAVTGCGRNYCVVSGGLSL